MLQKKMRRKIEEVLGGLTIIKVGHGIKVRRTKGPKRKQVLESPAFENSRTELNDFLTASKDSRTVREALQSGIMHVNDNRKHLRLNSAIRKITSEHSKSMHGQRNLLESGPQRLRGFEFNGRNGLSNTLKAHYQVHIDRAAGQAAVTLPGFSPLKHLRVPPGATHAVLHAVVAAIDFTKRKHKSTASSSVPLDVNEMAASDVKLEMAIPFAGNDPLFLGVGVYFVQYLHGVEYKLDNSDYSAFMLAAVDVVPDELTAADEATNDGIASAPKNDTPVAEIATGEGNIESPIAEAEHHTRKEEVLPAQKTFKRKAAPTPLQSPPQQEEKVEVNEVEEPTVSPLSVATHPDEPPATSEPANSHVIVSPPINNTPPPPEPEQNEQTLNETDVWPDVTEKQAKKSRQKEPKKQAMAQISLFGEDTAAPPPPAG